MSNPRVFQVHPDMVGRMRLRDGAMLADNALSTTQPPCKRKWTSWYVT